MPTQTDYKTALRCANLSRDVYGEFNDRLRFSELPNALPLLLENKSTDTQVALLVDVNQSGYIVFRGSEADRDWQTNFDFSKWSAVTGAVTDDKNFDYPEVYGESSTGVKLHRGFITAYLAVRSQIQAAVQDSTVTSWTITGHSLGGALAKLCAVDLQYNLGPDVSIAVYSFGAPRVGNKAFVESYNRRVPNTTRFVNGNDVVCGLPRRWQGYRHVEQRIRFQVPFTWRIISGSLQDHRLTSYIVALKKHLAI